MKEESKYPKRDIERWEKHGALGSLLTVPKAIAFFGLVGYLNELILDDQTIDLIWGLSTGAIFGCFMAAMDLKQYDNYLKSKAETPDEEDH